MLQNLASEPGVTAPTGIGLGPSALSPNATTPRIGGRLTRLKSPTLGLDFGTNTNAGQISARVYAPSAATLRLNDLHLRIAELSFTASSGSAPLFTVREFALVTTGPWARIYTRFENPRETKISDVCNLEGLDIDVGPSDRLDGDADRCSFYVAQNGPPQDVWVGMNSDTMTSGEAFANRLSDLVSILRDDAVGIPPGIVTGDVSLVRRWGVEVEARSSRAIRTAISVSPDRATLESQLARLARPLDTILGEIERRR